MSAEKKKAGKILKGGKMRLNCWVKLIGVWLFADAWFSIHTYWGKENLREQYIRVIRAICGIVLIVWG